LQTFSAKTKLTWSASGNGWSSSDYKKRQIDRLKRRGRLRRLGRPRR
jgi:hypothetical protein